MAYFVRHSECGSAFCRSMGLGPVTTPLIDEPALKKVAEKYSKTSAQVLLCNLIQRGIVVVPQSNSPERIKSNLEVSGYITSSLVDSISRGQ